MEAERKVIYSEPIGYIRKPITYRYVIGFCLPVRFENIYLQVNSFPYFCCSKLLLHIFYYLYMYRPLYRISFLLAFLLILNSIHSQPKNTVGDNLVPNGSFELLDQTPIGWYYNGKHFTDVMKYWESPTSTSPDAYTPKVRVPVNWEDKGFGKQKAKTGNNFVGMTLYGCSNGKPHCREYIQIQLREPLVIGQVYYCEFWVNHLLYGIRQNNIGAVFSEKRLNYGTEVQLTPKPQVVAKDIVVCKNLSWVRVSGTFEATNEAEFLIIGNFSNDSLTLTKQAWKDPLNFGYYYFDDVMLKKVTPLLPVPVKEDDLTLLQLDTGRVIQLKDIFFEFSKAELHPRSYVELEKLLTIMNQHPKMAIEVHGHTDTTGDERFNLELSEKRTQSVADFLVQNGIAAKRITTKGLGSSVPIASNGTEEGRALNRRVEFVILTL